MIQKTDGLNAEGYCRTCNLPLDIGGNCAQCDMPEFDLLSDKEIDDMEIPSLEEVAEIEAHYQANKKPQYWLESPFGIGGGIGDTFDFEEALNLAIEYAVDDNEVTQLRKDGDTDPCLVIVPAKLGVDMYEVKSISHDEVMEKYS